MARDREHETKNLKEFGKFISNSIIVGGNLVSFLKRATQQLVYLLRKHYELLYLICLRLPQLMGLSSASGGLLCNYRYVFWQMVNETSSIPKIYCSRSPTGYLANRVCILVYENGGGDCEQRIFALKGNLMVPFWNLYCRDWFGNLEILSF